MSDGELLINKRKLPRWKCTLSVKFKVMKDDKFGALKNVFVKSHEGQSIDISAGGTLLVTNVKLNAGDRLSMSIYLPATDSNVKVLGEIIRVTEKDEDGEKKYFIGIKYVDIITESDEVLEEILDQKLKAGAKTKLSKEDAMKQARYEYFMRLINEETFSYDTGADNK